MRLGWLLAALAVIVVALVSVVAVYNMMQNNEAQYYSPMKDGIIAFIASNHPDAVGFLTNLDLKFKRHTRQNPLVRDNLKRDYN
jgi:hypothetical protein